MNKELYLSHENVQFWADFSFVDFSNDFLNKMADPIGKALEAMNELEAGAIANPDENRMVGHYWLRNPEIAHNEKLSTDINNALSKVKEITHAVHSG